MAKHLLLEKSFNFSLRIVRLAQHLNERKREYLLSRKIMDSGVSIGVFVEEAQQGVDRADFIQRYAVANKEAFKTNYWIRLLRESQLINEKEAESLLGDCEELQRMLISAIKKSKGIT